MLSKHITNVIQNLDKKKYRDKYNLFKIEGTKLVCELLTSTFEIRAIFASEEWIDTHIDIIGDHSAIPLSTREMECVTGFKSAPEVIALAQIPSFQPIPQDVKTTLSIALNGIQDPGNLGTILRVCDWFGIHYIFCDDNCASLYNPKTVQASMGAIFRVNVYYVNLPTLIANYVGPNYLCYGTFLQGKNIYDTHLTTQGIIVMGNEGKGISSEIEKLVTHRLTIPNFSTNVCASESLNVGVATGIILSEFKRSKFV